MANIEFSQAEKDIIVGKISRYFSRELDQDIGQFDAEFLLDFFSKEVGAYFYNRGLNDAKAIIESKLDDIDEALYGIEKVTDFSK